MELIDKSALVAEIENLLDKGKYHEEYDCAYRDGNNGALYALKGKINTLEVKEVNLDEQDIYSILYFERIVMRELGDHEYSNEGLCREILKRYKAQKGEEV